MSTITRSSNKTSVGVVFTDSAATTGGFAYALYAGAMLSVSATSSGGAVTLTFGSRLSSDGGTLFAAMDDSGSAVTMTVEPGKCYPLPDALFAAIYVTATAASGATVTCTVTLKG